MDTRLARASCATIRLKLFKIGALVSVSVRRIKLAMNSACPFQRECVNDHGIGTPYFRAKGGLTHI
ncbi:transposase [Mesorhizobium sp. M0051]|uniref:transposase n=1 Tax=Mesorhizobium sp. M0051 TaxID=2956862 RepID=UPI00333C87ED